MHGEAMVAAGDMHRSRKYQFKKSLVPSMEGRELDELGEFYLLEKAEVASPLQVKQFGGSVFAWAMCRGRKYDGI